MTGATDVASETDSPLAGRDGALRARRAARTAFFLSGAIFSSWFVRIASVQVSLHVGDGLLGVVLAAPTVGAVIAMQFSGRLAARFGDAILVCCTAILLPLMFLLVSASRNAAELFVALTVFGTAVGMMDVAMNAEAVAVERVHGEPVLNSCHAAWSIGSIAGSLTAGWTVAAHWSFSLHAIVLAACAIAVVAAISGGFANGTAAPTAAKAGEGGESEPTGKELVDRTPPPQPQPQLRVRSWQQGWTKEVILLGTMGAICMLCEGSVGDWSAIFLHADRATPLGEASVGYIGFTIMQTAGRLIGDRLIKRFGTVPLVRTGSLAGAIFLACAVSVPGDVASIASFALLGAALSVIVPIVFGAVGHGGADRDGHAAIALLRFSTMTYTSFLIGPPIIGWLSSGLGMTTTLAILTVPLLWVGTNARSVGSQPFRT